jgi:hypothetical protein
MNLEPEHHLISPIHRQANAIRLAAVTSASKTFGSKWCESVAVARGFFDRKVPQRNDICYSPQRSKSVNSAG